MNYTKLGSKVKCHDCDFIESEDFFVVRDFGNHVIDFLCRVCEQNYPKTDLREWRYAHPVRWDAENRRYVEIVEFQDGSSAPMDRGIISGSFPICHEEAQQMATNSLLSTLAVFAVLIFLAGALFGGSVIAHYDQQIVDSYAEAK